MLSSLELFHRFSCFPSILFPSLSRWPTHTRAPSHDAPSTFFFLRSNKWGSRAQGACVAFFSLAAGYFLFNPSAFCGLPLDRAPLSPHGPFPNIYPSGRPRWAQKGKCCVAWAIVWRSGKGKPAFISAHLTGLFDGYMIGFVSSCLAGDSGGVFLRCVLFECAWSSITSLGDHDYNIWRRSHSEDMWSALSNTGGITWLDVSLVGGQVGKGHEART